MDSEGKVRGEDRKSPNVFTCTLVEANGMFTDTMSLAAPRHSLEKAKRDAARQESIREHVSNGARSYFMRHGILRMRWLKEGV